MLKKIRNIVLLIILSILGYWLYISFIVKDNSTNAFNLIPQDAVYVMHAKKPLKKWKKFSASELWQHIKTYPEFEEIMESANSIDEILEENNFALKLFSLKDLYISAHVHKPGDYEFLFLTDLANVSKSDIVKDNLGQLFGLADYQVSTQEYLGSRIYKCYDEESNETLYVTVLGNYLSCSYDKGILKKSIISYNEPVLAKDERFNNIVSVTNKSDDLEIYLNYKNLTQFLKVYLKEVDFGLREVIDQSYFSGLSASIEENDILIEGETHVNDSVKKILTVLAKAGNSKLNVDKVLSNQTSLFMRVGFKDFNSFFNQSVSLTSPTEKKKADRNIKLLELLFGFSLKDDFLSWIGDEIVLAQYTGKEDSPNGSPRIIAIRVTNKGEAEDKLDGVFKKLKRRLPYKLKGEVYKDYQIRRIETKGLFRLVFGKLFDKVQRPYFCFINDYVIFCDDLTQIKQTILDYEEGNVLSKAKEFKEVKKQLDSDNSFTAYLNPKLYFGNFKTTLNAESFSELKKNKKYVTCFNGFAFSLKSKGKGVFDTKMRNNFKLP
jgi:hypothetical protein